MSSNKSARPSATNKQPGSRSERRSYLRTLALLNIVTIIVPNAYYFAVVLQSWLHPGSGYEYAILGVAPVLGPLMLIGYGVAIVNIVGIPMYLRHAQPKRSKTIIGWLLVALSLGYVLLSMFMAFRQSQLNHDSYVNLSREETVTLINACQVAEIQNRRPYGVASQVTAREGATAREFAFRKTRGSDATFSDLKAIAYAASERCGDVKFQN